MSDMTHAEAKDLPGWCQLCFTRWPCDYEDMNQEIDRLAARVAELEAALPDPSKLWALADWIDVRFPDDANPEVQTDLRRWAREIMALGLHRGITAKEVLESEALVAPLGDTEG